jgi:exodeoxyribonuclease VII small subunit
MSEKSFEDAMSRLEDIVKDLESGELSLEDSFKVFEEGMKLIKFCSGKLEEVEQKVTMLVKDSDGKLVREDFDADEKDEN